MSLDKDAIVALIERDIGNAARLRAEVEQDLRIAVGTARVNTLVTASADAYAATHLVHVLVQLWQQATGKEWVEKEPQ